MRASTFDQILTQARQNAAKIQGLSSKMGVNVASHFPAEIKKLNDCLDTYSAAKVMISTVVEDAQGKLSLESAAKLFANFDKNWDKFAAEYNSIFSHMSPGAQTNVLETFARAQFGNTVFEAGSVLKNETPSILSGITSFRSGIDAFKGSFRDPQAAATKIKTGVSLIVTSTARIANSANNILKFLQKGRTTTPNGSVILGKIAGLPQMKPVAAALSALSAAESGIAGYNQMTGAVNSLRQGDLQGAATQGAAAAKQIRNTIQAFKGIKNGTVANLSSGTPSMGSAKVTKTTAPQANADQKSDSGGSDSYVCSTAQIKCSYGDKIAKLTVSPGRTIWLTGEPQANISDHLSMQNIAPFGKCHTTAYPATGAATAAAHGKLTPMPCVPNTPFPWMGGKNDVLLKGDPALLKSSKCKCVYGGTITITHDGQKNVVPAALICVKLDTRKELDVAAELSSDDTIDGLSAEELLDGLQLALDVAGFVPGWGAIPDLLNACIYALRGDWSNFGLSMLAAVPGIGDLAAAGKIMKNGAKIAKASKVGEAANSATDAVGSAAKAVKSHNASEVTQLRKYDGTESYLPKDEFSRYRMRKEAEHQMGMRDSNLRSIETKQEKITIKDGNGGGYEITVPKEKSKNETIKASIDDSVNRIHVGNSSNSSTYQNQQRGTQSGLSHNSGQKGGNGRGHQKTNNSIFDAVKKEGDAREHSSNNGTETIEEQIKKARDKFNELSRGGKANRPEFGLN